MFILVYLSIVIIFQVQNIVCQYGGQFDFKNPQYMPPDKRFYGSIYDPTLWEGRPCPPDTPWYCYQPPFYPYDEILVTIPGIGEVGGRSMIYQDGRYINWFLGIPYAKPPIDKLRFKPPEDPGVNWDLGIRKWDASYYRNACPQELWQNAHLYYAPRNMSEDCLHLNIFAPNLTDRPLWRNKDYPVFVYVHGEDYKIGDALLTPGHVIAKKEVIVITFNYRLGALGFLSTLDSHSPGNYGLYDLLKVLEWIQKYIINFRGDPNKVTLIGSDSGAAMISLLLLSPKSIVDGKKLFHRAILMSGSDFCEWAYIGKIYETTAYNYARELARQAGCDSLDYRITTEQIVRCMRMKHYEDIVNASANVFKMQGSLAGPFGPVVDGPNGILPDTPQNLRSKKKFMEIPIIAGFNRDEGSFIADNLTRNIPGVDMNKGLDPATFRQLIYNLVRARASIRNVDEVVGAIEYEYTFWTKPDNYTAVRQNLIDLWTDMKYGWCVDAVLKNHMMTFPKTPVYMYYFTHRSEYEVIPRWMGIPHGRDVNYLFGYPFYNDSIGNLTGIMPQQAEWTYLDTNISVFMMDMWVNFTKYGNPTTEWTRNVTWYPFVLYNLSYMYIAEWSYMDINYRQDQFAFWREYFPVVAARRPITTTPIPTPIPLLEFQTATWTLFGVSVIGLILISALGITFWRQTR